MARAPGVLAGTGVFAQVFTAVDTRLVVELLRPEGGRVVPGDTVAAVSGSLASILKAERGARGGSFKAMVARIRQRASHLVKIQVEVESLEEATEAAEAGADALLLDGMSPEQMGGGGRRYTGRILIEASGGVTLENVRRVAEN